MIGRARETSGRTGHSLNHVAQEPIVLDESLWNELVTLTGGAAGPCFQCGVCTAACPWGLVKEETFSVRTLMRAAQVGLDGALNEMWLCTACGQCESLCPRGVNIGDVMRGLRQLAWQKRETPPGLPTILWSIHGNNNPWGQPPSSRSAWAAGMNIPIFDPEQHTLLLFVGCTAAYDRRIQKVARALVKILRAAGESFGYLADDEPCCGEAALNLGHRPFFDELMSTAADRLRRSGVTRMVTVSPHCFDAFATHLPASSEMVEVMHYSSYLARLVEEGRLAMNGLEVGVVTLHDPCYLARHHADTSSVRTVLAAVPGIDLVEMVHHGRDTICCGGGGGRMWLETAPDERFADLRVAEAVQVKADCLITACPFCLTCLEDSLKANRQGEMEVLDLVELVSMAVDRGRWGAA